MKKDKYSFLLSSRTSDKWEKIKTNRRSGIAIPLFSLYSDSSTGIGEFTDLKLLIDWCKQNGFSIIQLLPLFDTGFDFCPYSSISSYALDYIYLNINVLKDINLEPYKGDLLTIEENFPVLNSRVNYGIKQAKLALLWKIYQDNKKSIINTFDSFINKNKYWLTDYAVFKMLSEKYNTSQWESWKENDRKHSKSLIQRCFEDYRDKIEFYIWLQWLISEQFKDIKRYANANGVLLLGDIPFLVSRNSADVWAHQNYFNLNLSAGAPPDMYSAYGQSWGMPTYKWEEIEKDKYVYLVNRLKSAVNYFDMYRIDHFIGLFRIWTMENTASHSNSAVNGYYDPQNESKWEAHGKKIINKLISSTSMLPCAEDLGTVPKCSNPTLFEYGIPGTDFQRFMKKDYQFIKPDSYRVNSISTLSTHDSTLFINWWDFEAESIERELFDIICKRNQVQGKRKKTIKAILFDKNKSRYGRLYWKKKLTLNKLKKYLIYFPESVHELTNLYLYTFNEKLKYQSYLGIKKVPAKNILVRKSLEAINKTQSIFSIQPLYEYLCLDSKLLKKMNNWQYRINKPGTVGPENWSIRLPVSLEQLFELEINNDISKINKKSKRVL